MIAHKLPDGTVIEVTGSDAYSGPNVEYGQRCGTAYWWRIGDQKWVRSNFRTMHRLVEWISLCETVQDFYDGERGYTINPPDAENKIVSITCHLCMRRSYHPKDVADRYCSNCEMSHVQNVD
jgi:hypothetical protein